MESSKVWAERVRRESEAKASPEERAKFNAWLASLPKGLPNPERSGDSQAIFNRPRHPSKRRRCGSILLALVLLGFPIMASAEGGNGWGIAPAMTADGQSRQYIVMEGAPGQTLTDAVVLSAGEDGIDVALLGVDALAQANGGWVIQTEGSTSGPGSWIRLEVPTLSLESLQSASVPVYVDIPADTLPGTYDAGILSLRIDPDAGPGMRMQAGAGIGLQVVVPPTSPERCGLAIEGMAAEADTLGQWMLSGLASNDGSGPFKGTALLTLAQADGVQVGQWEQAIGYVCGNGCPVRIVIPLPDAKAGEYNAALALVGDGSTTACAASWQGAIVIQAADISEARQSAEQVKRSDLVGLLVENGGILLGLGLGGLALALTLALVLWLRRPGRRW